MYMKKYFVTAWMITALWAGVSMEAKAQDVTAPPPPKPECKDIVYRKWNDLLFVDNGDEQFVSFQWYKNGVKIDDATQQFLYTQGVVMEGDGNTYYVEATTASGTQVLSCEGRFEDFPKSATLNPGKKIKSAVLYTCYGHKIGEWNEQPKHPAVQRGCYIWVLTDDKGNISSERVLY